ncbi:MAG: hypothetical protein HN380_29035 [Victivallales bacterium]|nr:hypothetical protein [Victivallales bacterium]
MPLPPMMMFGANQQNRYGKGSCPDCGFLLAEGAKSCPMCNDRRRAARGPGAGTVYKAAILVILGLLALWLFYLAT